MDFERWFQRQGEPAATPPAPEIQAPLAELPDGLWDDADGKLFYTCRGCDNTREWDMDPSEFDRDSAYCGGSPWCCP